VINSENDAWQKLLTLRELTKDTGGLHEAQILQLKTWPSFAFDDVQKLEFFWEDTRIFYTISLNRARPPRRDDFLMQKAILLKNVRELLGQEWTVNFTFKYKVSKKSRKKN